MKSRQHSTRSFWYGADKLVTMSIRNSSDLVTMNIRPGGRPSLIFRLGTRILRPRPSPPPPHTHTFNTHIHHNLLQTLGIQLKGTVPPPEKLSNTYTRFDFFLKINIE